MKDSTRTIRNMAMAMANTPGPLAVYMKDSGRTIRNMATANTLGPMAMYRRTVGGQ